MRSRPLSFFFIDYDGPHVTALAFVWSSLFIRLPSLFFPTREPRRHIKRRIAAECLSGRSLERKGKDGGPACDSCIDMASHPRFILFPSPLVCTLFIDVR